MSNLLSSKRYAPCPMRYALHTAENVGHWNPPEADWIGKRKEELDE